MLAAVALGGDLLGQFDELGDHFGRGELLVGVLPHQFGDALGERPLAHQVVPRDLARLLDEKCPQRLDREMRVRR